MPSVPWLVLGDFNAVKSMEERFDFYLGMPSSRSTLDFQAGLLDTEMLDLHYSGPTFTWSNKRSASFIAKRQDRILANIYWIQDIHALQAQFTTPSFSDHYAGWLFKSNPRVRTARSFKFFNFLIKNKDFLKTMHSVWLLHMAQICTSYAKILRL